MIHSGRSTCFCFLWEEGGNGDKPFTSKLVDDSWEIRADASLHEGAEICRMTDSAEHWLHVQVPSNGSVTEVESGISQEHSYNGESERHQQL